MQILHRSGPADLRSQLPQAIPANAGGFHSVREQQPQLLDQRRLLREHRQLLALQPARPHKAGAERQGQVAIPGALEPGGRFLAGQGLLLHRKAMALHRLAQQGHGPLARQQHAPGVGRGADELEPQLAERQHREAFPLGLFACTPGLGQG